MNIKVISIATHKGGTGKTVTSMALAAALARSRHQCLLVALDPQGHCTLGLGVELGDTDKTLREFFSEPPTPIQRLIRGTHIPCLSILPSNIRLARVAQSLYMRPKREEILKRGLELIRNEFEFIVIDCPPSLGVLTEIGIAAADLIIIPCQMEARAADGLVDLLEVVGIIKGENFNDWRILLTKVDSRKSTTNQAVMAALSPWTERIFKTSIPQSEPLNQAQIERTDIFTFDPKCKGSQAYETFTTEILTYGNEERPTDPAS
jgi:chromosome partitioning protein